MKSSRCRPTLLKPYEVSGVWQGRISYEKGLQIQQEYKERARHKKAFFLLGLEHENIITLGKRGTRAKDIVWTHASLEENGLHYIQTDRGGEATLHSPGQLVIYPIGHLPSFHWSVKCFVQNLMDVSQSCLESLGIPSESGEEPGLFTSKGKIAAFGIRVERGITSHGLSINCQNNLKLFESIRSCGVDRQQWTSLKEFEVRMNTQDLFKIWYEKFLASLL